MGGGERNDQLISPDLANGSNLLQSDPCSENLLSVHGKKCDTTENIGRNSTRKHIISKKGNKICIKFIKKCKNDILCGKQEIDGKLLSPGVNEQIQDTSVVSAQHSERNTCSLGKDTYVGGIRLNEPPGDDISKRISSKEPVGPDEVVPCEKQVPHFDTKLPNGKSVKEHGQENEILKARGQKEGDKFEPSIQSNIPDFSATDLVDLNMLADLCSRLVQSSEGQGCSLGKITYIGEKGQRRNPGDGNYEFTSSEGLIGPNKVLLHKKKVHHHDTKMPSEKFDEEKGQDHEAQNAGDNELNISNKYMNEFPKIVQRNSPNLGEAEEEDDISTDSDGYCNERAQDAVATDLKTNNEYMNEFPQVGQRNSPNLGEAEEYGYCDEQTDIATKKKAFWSSQCKNSRDSVATIDWKELNICVKCNKGGKLLVCSIKTCLVVIHESCLGSDASFSTGEEFYCPFCAYSRAISRYTAIKKKTSLARKEFATFVCRGTRKESKKQHHGSSRINQLHLEEDDGSHKINELKKAVAKDINTHHVREKRNGGESHGESRPNKRVLYSPQTDSPREYKCSPHSESADDQEISENNENSGASKCFVRVQKLKSQYSTSLPQLRRKRVPWTTAEEEKLKEGMRRFYSPNDRFIPWKKIHEFGAAVFHDSRSTIDLKDKWRNLCKASPKS